VLESCGQSDATSMTLKSPPRNFGALLPMMGNQAAMPHQAFAEELPRID
jgi:hypothetical protein